MKPGDRVISPNGSTATVLEVCPIIGDLRLRFDADSEYVRLGGDPNCTRFWFNPVEFAKIDGVPSE